MKRQKANSDEVLTIKKTKKNSKNKKVKKRVKRLRNEIFRQSQFDSSDFTNRRAPKRVSELTTNSEQLSSHSSDEMLCESEDKIVLTPSKSEGESSQYLISDFEESSKTCNSFEDSFNTSSIQNDSFSYSNILDEFINEDAEEDNCMIVSLPVVNKQNDKDSDVNVVIDESSTHAPLKKAKKIKVKKTRLEKTGNSVSSSSDIINTDISVKTLQHYETDDGIIVVLEKNETIYFHGLMSLSVLHGEIEVLGYTLTKNSQDVKLYSPRGSSLLYLKNVTASDIPVKNYLISLKILNEAKLTENCAILLCKKLDETNISFIEKHVSQQILPRIEKPNLPRVVLQPRGSWNVVKTSHKWDTIVGGIDKSTKMLVCGGKGVGKTTFLRYAVNQLLMRFDEVRIIDLDPGQSEFTIPGCISIVKVKEPIFGVNYTHLKSAERSLLSNINIAYDPEKYIATVKCLLNTSLDAAPTLINFMGYTHGAGLNIISAVTVYVEPTDILQILSEDSKKNYKYKLTVEVVKENAKLFVNSVPDLSYKLHEIKSMSDQNDGWTAEPRQLREMSILSYISQMIDSNSIFKTKLPLYKINLSAVNITDLNGEVIHPAAINASLVALCSLEEESLHIFRCFGWGIVRGVDVASSMLVLLTSEKLETLGKVSHIVLHGATLPPSVYMTPDEVTGQMPYVIEGVLMSFGQIPKRSRISVKNQI